MRELVIDGYGVETLPSWLGHCSYEAMVSVRLTNCCNCRVLPPLGQLPSLQELQIHRCHGVERIDAEFYSDGSFSNIKPFRSLKRLEFEHLSKWQEWSFPESREDDECFPSLEHLRIRDCPKLNVCLPDNFRHFPCLEELRIEDCEELQRFLGEGLHPLTSLHLKRLPKLEDLGKGLQHLISFKELSIQDCENLQCLSENRLPMSLTFLHLYELPKIEDLGKGGLQHLISLKELCIQDCGNLQCLSENGLPTSLISLCLYKLPKLEDLGKGGLQHLITLKELIIRNCEKLNLRCLSEHGGLKNLISLKDLAIIDSEKLLGLLEEGLPRSLTSLWINGFQNLRDLNRMGFQHLISLGCLLIWKCGNLQCLPEQGLPSSLSSLDISECPLLNPRCQKGTGSDWHKISHIPFVKIDGISIA